MLAGVHLAMGPVFPYIYQCRKRIEGQAMSITLTINQFIYPGKILAATKDLPCVKSKIKILVFLLMKVCGFLLEKFLDTLQNPEIDRMNSGVLYLIHCFYKLQAFPQPIGSTGRRSQRHCFYILLFYKLRSFRRSLMKISSFILG